MDYERNRSRINQLGKLGAVPTSEGFRINNQAGSYIITTENITYLHDGAWEVMLTQLPTHQTDKQAFDSYIKRLNEIKAPVLKDKRLGEMVDIMNDLIIEYTSYTQQELKGAEPLCYQLADKIKLSKTE